MEPDRCSRSWSCAAMLGLALVAWAVLLAAGIGLAALFG